MRPLRVLFLTLTLAGSLTGCQASVDHESCDFDYDYGYDCEAYTWDAQYTPSGDGWFVLTPCVAVEHQGDQTYGYDASACCEDGYRPIAYDGEVVTCACDEEEEEEED